MQEINAIVTIMLTSFIFPLFLHLLNTGNPNFKHRLNIHGRRRRCRRITRKALIRPSLSPFTFLYNSGCDQSLITLTGIDHKAFRYMQSRFDKLFIQLTPYSADGYLRILWNQGIRKGRPRLMTSTQCLALLLAWYRTRGSLITLCIVFGIIHSVASLYIRFARRLVYKILVHDENARVRMPSQEEIEQFKMAFQQKRSLLTDLFCVADGLKLYLQQSGDCVIQNMFYNGWTHDHYVGNVFVFAPNVCVISCAVNAPGAFHDSTIADWGSVYKKLEQAFEQTGGKCVVDSAFCRESHPFLIKSAQDYLGTGNNPQEILMLRQATSARQGSEWGMRALKARFQGCVIECYTRRRGKES